MNDLREISTRVGQIEQHMQLLAERQKAFTFRQILAVTLLCVLFFFQLIGLFWLHSLASVPP